MGLFSKRWKTATPDGEPHNTTIDGQTLLADCVTRHFSSGIRHGQTIDTGLRGADGSTVTIQTELNRLDPFAGTQFMSSVFFNVAGGPFGQAPVFASASGYGASEAEAVVMGACNWSCTFRPLARAACGLSLGPESDSVTDTAVMSPSGRSFRLVYDGWARTIVGHGDGAEPATHGDGAEPAALWNTVRADLTEGGQSLTPIVAASGLLPELAQDRVTLLSTFVMEAPDARIVEVKVNGVDQERAASTLFRRENESSAGPNLVLIRELAVLIPS